MAKGKSKYYVVWVGVQPGIYTSWQDCQLQIRGYPNATYKSYKTRLEAEKAYKESAADHIGTGNGTKKGSTSYLEFSDEIQMESLSVDAACSKNPGIMEYQGVATKTGEVIFHKGPFAEGTNNIGEFLALVHALAHLKKSGMSNVPIYTDSKTAQAWVRNKQVRTTLKKSSQNEILFVLMQRAVAWLKSNQYENKILKWNTEKWGEIPADFGRK